MIKLHPKLREFFGTYRQIPAKEPNMPVFITGCMRSGTTFLFNKLSAHPQLIKIGAELNSVWSKIGGASCTTKCEYRNENDADAVYIYNMNHYFFEFIEESKSLKRHLMRAKRWIEKNSGRIFYDWDNIIPVNKSPHLINKIRYVNALFPESRILLLVRNIHAHSASMKFHLKEIHHESDRSYYMPDNPKNCWTVRNDSRNAGQSPETSYPPDFSLIPKMWLRLNKLALEEIEQLDPNLYRVISYEDLVRQQQNILNKIFQFLPLQEEYTQISEKIARKKLSYKNTSTKGDPLKKWERNLSEKEKEIIDIIIDDNMDIYRFINDKMNELKVNP